MKILILEDNELRNNQFRKNLIGHTIEIVDNVKDLKTHLLRTQWDILFLDHDLGGEHYISFENENTGSGAARWLNQNPDKQPPMIFLHSLNESGRKNMKSLLPKSVGTPFIWSLLDSETITTEYFRTEVFKLAERQNITGEC